MTDTGFYSAAPLNFDHITFLKPSRVTIGAHRISDKIPKGIRAWLMEEKIAQAAGQYPRPDIAANHWLHRRDGWIARHNASAA